MEPVVVQEFGGVTRASRSYKDCPKINLGCCVKSSGKFCDTFFQPRHLFVGHVGHAMPGSNSEFQIGSLDYVFSGLWLRPWVDVSDFCGEVVVSSGGMYNTNFPKWEDATWTGWIG